MTVASTRLFLPSLLLTATSYAVRGFSSCGNNNALVRNQAGAVAGVVFLRPEQHHLQQQDRQQRTSRLFSSAASGTTSDDEGPSLPELDPNSKRLFLVRHGEVVNPGGDRPVYYGAMDVPLSELGQAEARAAGDYLQQFDLEYVVCSPLKRAIYGAEQVYERQSSRPNDILTLEGFRELDRGAWCGMTKAEIGDDMMARFDACDESVTPEGGESFPFLKERVLKARDEVLDKLPNGKSAAVVSHLQVTRSLLSEAMGIPIEKMVELKVATASVSCVDYDSETGKQTVHFQSFKPEVGLEASKDGAN